LFGIPSSRRGEKSAATPIGFRTGRGKGREGSLTKGSWPILKKKKWGNGKRIQLERLIKVWRLGRGRESMDHPKPPTNELAISELAPAALIPGCNDRERGRLCQQRKRKEGKTDASLDRRGGKGVISVVTSLAGRERGVHEFKKKKENDKRGGG